ncbi:MAG: Uncharacterised protein [Hyphomonas sp. TMED17]|nr:MAG: Uncharacterised protein [Hyphomonas sp. TMED17]
MQVLDRRPVDNGFVLTRQCHSLGQRIDIGTDCPSSRFRLFVDFLLHEMAIIAFFGSCSAALHDRNRALDCCAVFGINLGSVRSQNTPVAFLEIDNSVGERCDRERVGSEQHFIVANSDDKRRPLAGAHDHVVLTFN